MKSVWNILHKASEILHLPDMPTWLIGILALVLILRVPSFFEPYYYGDEMIYISLGQGVRQGLTLYKDIYDNKPPLLYLTAALAGNLFWFKAILAFWSLATIVIFYKLTEELFAKSKRAQMAATVIFALFTTLPLLEGNIANAELFMIGPSILAFLLLLGKNLNSKKVFFAGILFGIATLFKVPAAFEAPVIVFYWAITQGFTRWKEILKNTLLLSSGFVVPMLLTFVWYFFKGALHEYLNAAFLQNLSYVHTWTARDVPMAVRAGVVAVSSLVLFLYRKRLSHNFILFCLWLVFALFAIVLSGRPYPHYLIQALAPTSLLLAMLFGDRTIEQSLTVIPLALAFFVPMYYKFWLYPTTTYYQRFLKFATHQTNKQTYFYEFNRNVDRDYELANFLVMSSEPKDRVFMWDTDSPTVYALSRKLPPIKYVADVAKLLTQDPPKFIILTNEPFGEISPLLLSKYLLIDQIGNANIFARVDFVPKAK